MFRFASPWFLFLLVLPLVFVWRERRASREGTGPALFLARLTPRNAADPAGSDGAGQAGPSLWLRLYPVVQAFRPLALTLMILALAGPQWGTRQASQMTEGIAMVMALDVSESMAALDFTLSGENVNRLDAVKAVARDFVSGRKGDRIGLVAFGSEAYTIVPLTRDYPALVNAVEGLRIGAAGGRTALGDALGIAVKRLREAPGTSKAAIILTDGRSNAGEFSPETATALAKRAGVKVYAIGVGGDKPAPFLVNDPLLGRRIAYQRADIDEKTLRDMAEATGGAYFRAVDSRALEEVYRSIGQMEKTKAEVIVRADYNDLYPWPLGAAVILLGAWAALASTRLMRLA